MAHNHMPQRDHPTGESAGIRPRGTTLPRRHTKKETFIIGVRPVVSGDGKKDAGGSVAEIERECLRGKSTSQNDPKYAPLPNGKIPHSVKPAFSPRLAMGDPPRSGIQERDPSRSCRPNRDNWHGVLTVDRWIRLPARRGRNLVRAPVDHVKGTNGKNLRRTSR